MKSTVAGIITNIDEIPSQIDFSDNTKAKMWLG